MPSVNMSVPEMMKRVARRDQIRSSDKAFVDVLLPDHEREIFNVIGPGVTENPDDEGLRPAITGVEGFNLAYIRSMPGKRGALHAHDTVEVFIPMSGRWIIIWGDDGEHQLELGTGDVIAVPPGVMRCFKNISDEQAWLLAVLGGTTPGRITWPEGVIRQVAAEGVKYGIGLNEQGDLVRLATP